MANINLHHGDCMEAMRQMPDNAYDLAIVDPPYGISITKSNRLSISRGFGGKDWDVSVPDESYFSNLRRVSRNQIIWGGNYFITHLDNTKCYLIWDKKNDGRDFAESELAWTSFTSVSRTFRMRPQNMDGGKIHPTQKPVKLYKWLLSNYAKEGDKILDTHLGSGSIAIACHDLGFSLDGWEIDREYYDNLVLRYKQHASQLQMF